MEVIMLVGRVIIYWIIGFFLLSLAHELGHVVCGLIHGWKLSMLVVGPFKIYRETPDSKIKIGIEKNVMLWGGVGGTFPKENDDNNIKVWGKILLAGPIVSIVVGTIAGALCVFHHSLFLLMICAMSFGMGLICLIPSKMKTGITYTDGTRYKRLKSGGNEALEEEALFMLVEFSLFAKEEDLYPEKIINPLVNSKEPEFKYYGYYCLYHNAKINGDDEEKEKQCINMEQIKDKVPKIIIESCKL